jgi:DNA helicase-2/ATP-dependent DNA helicase PcrA
VSSHTPIAELARLNEAQRAAVEHPPRASAQGRNRFPLAATCVAIHSRCVNTRQPLAAVLSAHFPWCVPHETALHGLFAGFAAARQEQHSLDFDDLLLAWWHLLQAPGWAERLRARFDHVLVDELQDVNGADCRG